MGSNKPDMARPVKILLAIPPLLYTAILSVAFVLGTAPALAALETIPVWGWLSLACQSAILFLSVLYREYCLLREARDKE